MSKIIEVTKQLKKKLSFSNETTAVHVTNPFILGLDIHGVLDMLNKLKIEFQKDYDDASIASDGELNVHNDYEQGREDALNLIIEEVGKL